jgi:undecaprenyl-diphosphatase
MPDVDWLDQMALVSVNSQAVPGYQYFFLAVTQLGQAYFWLTALVAYFVFGREKKIAAALLIVLVCSMVINEDLKDIFQRIRPNNAQAGNYFTGHDYSFPSGHSQTAFLMATLLAAYLGWRSGIVAYFGASAVAYSRIYLGYHYLTDVVMGAIIGIIIGEIAIYILWRYGLHSGGGAIATVMRRAGYRRPETAAGARVLHTGLVVAFCGLVSAMVALLLSWYVASLAILLIMIIAAILVPFLLTKNTEAGGVYQKYNK